MYILSERQNKFRLAYWFLSLRIGMRAFSMGHMILHFHRMHFCWQGHHGMKRRLKKMLSGGFYS